MTSQTKEKQGINKKLVGTIAGLAVAVIFFLIPPPNGLEVAAMRYLGIFFCMLIFLVLSVAPSHVTILMALSALVIFGVCDATTAVSGYGSSTVWFIATVFGFAAGLTKSGVLKRLAFKLLTLFPETYVGQILAVTITSTVISPTIPSGQAKAGILAPITTTLAQEFGFEQGSRPAAGLWSAMYIPALVAAHAWTTSVGYALISGYSDTSMSFMEYLKITGPWFVVLVVLNFLFCAIFYRPQGETASFEKGIVKRKLAELGPMQKQEKIGGIILVCAILLWVTERFHGIPSVIVSFMALIAMSLTGLLNNSEFATKIPWSMVVMIGGIMSISGLLRTLGINDWIAGVLAPYAETFVSNPFIYVIVVCILIYILRQFIIDQVAPVLITLAMFGALALENGIPMIITVFIAFSGTLVFNIPFMSLAYLPAEAATGGFIRFKDVKYTAYAFFVMNLLAFLASVPIWKMLGVIG